MTRSVFVYLRSSLICSINMNSLQFNYSLNTKYSHLIKNNKQELKCWKIFEISYFDVVRIWVVCAVYLTTNWDSCFHRHTQTPKPAHTGSVSVEFGNSARVCPASFLISSFAATALTLRRRLCLWLAPFCTSIFISYSSPSAFTPTRFLQRTFVYSLTHLTS